MNVPRWKSHSTRKQFDEIAEQFNHPDFLQTDPILFCYRFTKREDIEIIGFIASMFSYGNVISIQNFLEKLLKGLNNSPYQKIKNENLSFSSNIYYRFQTNKDIHIFFQGLQALLKSSTSLEFYFLDDSYSTQERIQSFQNKFTSTILKLTGEKKLSNGLKFLIGSGSKNSANKRYNMFLRWMVRDTFPDFGLYKTFQKKDIIYPLDTHIVKLSKILGLSNLKTINANMAREITENVKQINSEDPLLYDFPLSRLGILKICKTKYVKEICSTCVLKKMCTIYAPYNQSHP
jgi:uncharacterized protein (TIGR02757 family)